MYDYSNLHYFYYSLLYLHIYSETNRYKPQVEMIYIDLSRIIYTIHILLMVALYLTIGQQL